MRGHVLIVAGHSSVPSTWSVTYALVSHPTPSRPISSRPHALDPSVTSLHAWCCPYLDAYLHLSHSPDTKEKPYVCCQCGAAFARRDLLTRHQRIALHEDASESPDGPTEPDSGEQNHGPVEADLAAAVSLSGMSVHHWPQQQPAPPAELYPMAASRNGTLVDDGPYQQGLLAEPFYESGMSSIPSNFTLTLSPSEQS